MAGNNGNCWGRAIGTDNLGNVITAGNFNDEVDFDPGLDMYNLAASGFQSVYVHKLSQLATSVDDKLELPIGVFPNPSDGVVQVSWVGNETVMNYAITNMLGQNVLTGRLEKNNPTIDLSEFEEGVYVIEFVDKTESSSSVRVSLIK
jgi:hypothetical protein